MKVKNNAGSDVSFSWLFSRLLRLTEMGSPGDPNRGAVLNTARAVATLLIPANDEPHGVIRWARTLIIAQDTGPKNVTLPLTIDRYPGLLGAVVVSYETVTPQGLSNHDDQVAQPGVDFRSVKSEVVIPAGVNSTQISLDITHVRAHLTLNFGSVMIDTSVRGFVDVMMMCLIE